MKVKKPDGLVSETLKGIPLPGGLGRNTPHYYGGEICRTPWPVYIRAGGLFENAKNELEEIEVAARKGMECAQALPGNDVLTTR